MSHFIKLLLITFFVVCTSCNPGENKNADFAKAMELSKEAALLIDTAMKLEMAGSQSSSTTYYRQALDKFLAAKNADPSHEFFGMYLPDLYSKLNMQDSAAYWRAKLPPEK